MNFEVTKPSKVFIGLPCSPTREAVENVYIEILAKLREKFGENEVVLLEPWQIGTPETDKITVLPPYQHLEFTEIEGNGGNLHIAMLGAAILALSYADYAIFADGWQDSVYCVVAREICKQFGIKTNLD
jgi:hypothetical protein